MSDELPEGWANTTLMGVCRSITDGDHQAPPKAAVGIPFITISAINDGVLRLKKATRFVAASYFNALKPERQPEIGDVLFSVTGSIGLAALVDVSTPFVFQRHIAILKPDTSRVADRFLRHRVVAVDIKTQSEEAATGTAQLTIPLGGLRDFSFALPPLPEQHRIVVKIEALLEQVNRAKGRLDRVPLILKRFRQAVLAAACSGELTREWRTEQTGAIADARAFLRGILDDRPIRFAEDQANRLSGRRGSYKEATAPAKHDDLPELPDSWEWTSLDALTFKIADGVHSKPSYVKTGVPFVTVRNLTAGSGIEFTNLNHVTREDHLRFIDRANPSRGDILISKDGTLGVVRAVRDETVFSIFVSVALAKPVSRSMTDYLELALSAPQVQQRMIPTGSGLQHLHLRDLRTVPIPVPGAAEQREIVSRVGKLLALADGIEQRVLASTARADKLPQAILSKAFSGELVPTEAELARADGRAYETAAELLARVTAAGASERVSRTRVKAGAASATKEAAERRGRSRTAKP